MIVCHCNVISKSDIEEVVHGFLEKDAWQLITVGMVYHAMEKRGKCCGCFPNAIAIIVDCVEKWHRSNATPEPDLFVFRAKTRDTLSQQEFRRRATKALYVERKVA